MKTGMVRYFAVGALALALTQCTGSSVAADVRQMDAIATDSGDGGRCVNSSPTAPWSAMAATFQYTAGSAGSSRPDAGTCWTNLTYTVATQRLTGYFCPSAGMWAGGGMTTRVDRMLTAQEVADLTVELNALRTCDVQCLVGFDGPFNQGSVDSRPPIDFGSCLSGQAGVAREVFVEYNGILTLMATLARAQ